MTDTTGSAAIFDWRRGAIIAVGVTAFIALFRPFGVSISSPAALALIFGFAPINFAAILLAHKLPAKGAMVFIRPAAVIVANLGYAFAISGGPKLSTAVAVIFVALLVAGAVALWNRERSLHREVIELRRRPGPETDEVIVLRGENDRDMLRLSPRDLLYVAAKGNYSEVAYLRNGAPVTALLRTSLKSIAEQTGEAALTRSHRSFLVNLNAAQRITAKSDIMTIAFPGGVSAPVSRQHRSAIRAAAAKAAPPVPPAAHSSRDD